MLNYVNDLINPSRPVAHLIGPSGAKTNCGKSVRWGSDAAMIHDSHVENFAEKCGECHEHDDADDDAQRYQNNRALARG